MERAPRSGVTGALVVGQSGGCTHVMNASLRGIVEAASRSRNVTEILGMRFGIEGVIKNDFSVLPRADSASGKKIWEKIERVPAAALGSCRRRLSDADAARAVEILAKKNIRFFIYIGGNDSADTAHKLALAAAREKYSLSVVCVPKTIDNDLPLTDHCPGYGSAARFIASTVADVGIETEAMRTVEPVRIVEVMGRNAGWLAAASVLAKRNEKDAPHVVWPPEIRMSEKRFLDLVKKNLKTLGYCVAVVAETVRNEKGRPVASNRPNPGADSFGHPRIVGAAEYLCELVKDRLSVRARWDKPGSIQRMSSAHFSEVDIREARACGAWAVRCAVRGNSDAMVVMTRKGGSSYRIGFALAPLSGIANSEKLLPRNFFDREKMLPTAAFRKYALPLVGTGLPQHARL